MEKLNSMNILSLYLSLQLQINGIIVEINSCECHNPIIEIHRTVAAQFCEDNDMAIVQFGLKFFFFEQVPKSRILHKFYGIEKGPH